MGKYKKAKEVKTEWAICKDIEKDFYYICNDTEVYTGDDGENIHFETREEAEDFAIRKELLWITKY